MKYKNVRGTIGIKIQTEAYEKIAQEAQRRGCNLYQAANYLLGIEENKLPEEKENASNLKTEIEKLKKENEELLKEKKENEKWLKKMETL